MNNTDELNEAAKPENMKPGDVLQTSHTMKMAAQGKPLGTVQERPDVTTVPEEAVDFVPTKLDPKR